jgi:hypothetical protein
MARFNDICVQAASIRRSEGRHAIMAFLDFAKKVKVLRVALDVVAFDVRKGSIVGALLVVLKLVVATGNLCCEDARLE